MSLFVWISQEKAYVKGTGVYNYGNETEERARKAAEDGQFRVPMLCVDLCVYVCHGIWK